MEWQLALAAGAEAIAAGSYVAVAVLLGRKQVSPAVAPAHQSFIVWWWGAAAHSATTAMLLVTVADGPMASDVSLLLHALRVTIVATAAGALTFYVLFFYRPTHRLRWPVAVYYGAVGAWTLSWALRRGPVRFHAHEWYMELHYVRPLAPSDLIVVVALFAVPLLAGICLYLGLQGKTSTPVLRRRIQLVGWSLLAWLGSTLAAVGADSDLGLLLTSVTLGIASAVAVVVAYALPDGA